MKTYSLMGLTALLLLSAQQAAAAFPEDFSVEAQRKSQREVENAIESQSINTLQQRQESESVGQEEQMEEEDVMDTMEEENTAEENIEEKTVAPSISNDMVLTRAVFTAVLVRELYPAAEIDDCYSDIASSLPPRFTLVFTDVHVDDPYAKEICIAMRDGLIEGYRDGSFRPRQTINLAEGSKILARAYSLAPYAELERNDLWFGPYLYALAVRNVVPANMRSVDQALTVGDLREMVARIAGDITWRPTRSYDDLTAALLPRRTVVPGTPGSTVESSGASSTPRRQVRSSSSSSFPRSRISTSSEGGDWWNPFD